MKVLYVTTTPQLLSLDTVLPWIERLRFETATLAPDIVESPDLDATLHIVLTADPFDAPFRVYSQNLVVLSIYQLEGFAHYTRKEPEDCLALYLHLALIQRNTLARNPLLIAEDLIHPKDQTCLMNPPTMIEEYALILENLDFCHGCHTFYNRVSCENELISLSKYRNLLKSLPEQTHSRYDSPAI